MLIEVCADAGVNPILGDRTNNTVAVMIIPFV